MLETSLLRIVLTRSFEAFVFRNQYQNRLDFENLDELGLYVHIPFCRSLCSFCPYCKEVFNQQKAIAYKSALLREIDIVCSHLKGKKPATSLYFGGGTPALMIDDLKDIIEKLQQYFVIDGGIGVELHPSDISQENLRKLKNAGINMLSIGIQSFNEGCLAKLGRRGDRFSERLQQVKNYGFEVVDVDLIFAIPGQTEAILAEDIKTAFENGATQVSTYPFIDFTFADNQYKPMSAGAKKKMLKGLVEYCGNNGIERTSVWTWAQPGSEKYSSVTRDSFLGFGVSATTLLQKSFKINTFSIDKYIERVSQDLLPTSLTLNFSPRQRAVYFLFWSAYSMRISPDKFEQIIGVPLKKMFGLEFFLAESTGLVRKNGTGYELSNRAANIYHSIEQAYTTAYIDKMWNISRNQAFPEEIILR